MHLIRAGQSTGDKVSSEEISALFLMRRMICQENSITAESDTKCGGRQ